MANETVDNYLTEEKAVQLLKKYLKIQNDSLFAFEVLKKDHNAIMIKVIANELQSSGGSGTYNEAAQT